MNLKGLERYYEEIYRKITAYAVENRNEPVLFNRIPIDWKGEIFDTSNIVKELHKDLIEDLKRLNMYDDIVKYTDKFVILPDVFSARSLPLNIQISEQYDEAGRSIVIINDLLFSVIKENMTKCYSYNHNGYYYFFYKNSESQNIFSSGHKFEIVSLRDSFSYLKPDTSKSPVFDKTFYWLPLNKNVNIEANLNVPRIDIIVNRPFFRFKVDKNPVAVSTESLPGNRSVEFHDAFISPKMYTFVQSGDYIHNPDAILSSSAFIIFDDNSWTHEKLDINQAGTYLEKIDKHSVKVKNTTNVKEIIIFYTNHKRQDFSNVDSVYYESVDINPLAYQKLKGSQKDTTKLYEYIYNNKPSVPELIEYGYKYDADVLKIVEDFFKVKHSINMSEVRIINEIQNEIFYEPKIEIKCVNKLKLHPVVFVNGRIYQNVPFIRKVDDLDCIYLNAKDLMKMLNIEFDEKDFTNNRENTLNNVKARLEGNLHAIDVVYTQSKKLINNFTSPVIYREPLTKYLVCDEYGETEHKGRFAGHMFANGYYTPETFDINPDGTLKNPDILRRFDSINLWKLGDLDFTLTTTPTKADLWKPRKTLYKDKYGIFHDFGRQTVFYRLTDPLYAVLRVYFKTTKPILIDYTSNNFTTKFANHMSEYNSLMFDSCGGYVHGSRVFGNQLPFRGNYASYASIPDEVVDTTYVIKDLIPQNIKHGLNPVIDFTRLATENANVGFYNDNTLTNYPFVKEYLVFDEDSFDGPAQELQSPELTMFNKVMLRYYYSNIGIEPYKVAEFNTEIAPLAGKWIKPNGILGDLTDDEKKLVEPVHESINKRLVSEAVWYKLLSSQPRYANSREKEPISIGSDIVDNTKKYNLNYEDVEDYYIDDKINLSGILNIVTKGVGN